MKRQFQVIQWSKDMKDGYREALGLMTRRKQNEIFYRNAVLRQKIASIIFCLCVIAFWAWLMISDPVCVWYAPLAFTAVITGLWVFSLDRLITEEREEKEYGSSRVESKRTI